MAIPLSNQAATADWLAQFRPAELPIARKLVDALMMVSRDDFATAIYDEIELLYQQQLETTGPQPIALYAEHPIRKVFGRIPAYFPDSRNGRATGAGVSPIKVEPRDQEVGSEAIVANMITSFCRYRPEAALSHPGPDDLRANKVRTIVLVTDFIGSGDRILRNLNSLGHVATLKSWRSGGFIKFAVIAYSGSKAGIDFVSRHHLQPSVRVIHGCPTIKSEFRGAERADIERLCGKYPKGHRRRLGWGETGALIAFAHGIPNNAPALFHSSARRWKPLFRKRSSVSLNDAFVDISAMENTMARAVKLLTSKTTRDFLLDDDSARWVKSMIILAACQDGFRLDHDLSIRTFLPQREVAELCDKLIQVGWLDAGRKLTDVGRSELETLRKRRKRNPVFPIGNQFFYYPTQLRVP